MASDNAATNTVAVTDMMQRLGFVLPVTTTRWRLRARNARNSGGAISGAMTLTDIYVGRPADSAGAATGSFTGTPSLAVSASGQTFGDAEYVSPWVTDPALQFAHDTMYLLGIGWTNTNGQVITYSGTGGSKAVGMLWTGSGASASVGAKDPGGSSLFGACYGDIRIEYEAVTDYPVVLCLGDSLTVGWTDDATKIGLIRAALGVNSWPAQAALVERFCAVNAGVQGAGIADFVDTSASNLRYARFDLATTIPDVAIIALGINDRGSSVSTWEANYLSVIAALKALGIQHIYGATLIPWPGAKAGAVLAAAASGVSSLKTSVAYANSDSVTIDTGMTTAETLTVSGASVADGSGAYTTSFTGTTAQPHAILAPITQTDNRATMNIWLRGGPPGLSGVFDFARAVNDQRFLDAPDANLFGAVAPSTPHPGRGAYLQMARMVRIR